MSGDKPGPEHNSDEFKKNINELKNKIQTATDDALNKSLQSLKIFISQATAGEQSGVNIIEIQAAITEYIKELENPKTKQEEEIKKFLGEVLEQQLKNKELQQKQLEEQLRLQAEAAERAAAEAALGKAKADRADKIRPLNEIISSMVLYLENPANGSKAEFLNNMQELKKASMDQNLPEDIRTKLGETVKNMENVMSLDRNVDFSNPKSAMNGALRGNLNSLQGYLGQELQADGKIKPPVNSPENQKQVDELAKEITLKTVIKDKKQALELAQSAVDNKLDSKQVTDVINTKTAPPQGKSHINLMADIKSDFAKQHNINELLKEHELAPKDKEAISKHMMSNNTTPLSTVVAAVRFAQAESPGSEVNVADAIEKYNSQLSSHQPGFEVYINEAISLHKELQLDSHQIVTCATLAESLKEHGSKPTMREIAEAVKTLGIQKNDLSTDKTKQQERVMARIEEERTKAEEKAQQEALTKAKLEQSQAVNQEPPKSSNTTKPQPPAPGDANKG